MIITKQHINKILLYCTLAIVLVVILFPLYWTFATSIKPREDIFNYPPTWVFEPTLSNYSHVLTKTPFPNYMLNSLIVASVTTLLAILLGSLTGYYLARFKFRGSNHLAFWILSIRMFPPIVSIIPLYFFMSTLRLLDTHFCLILQYLCFSLPIAVWVMMSFFAEISPSFEESAMVDGCSRLGALRRVVLPIAMPGIVASALLIFIFCWNEFLIAFVFTTVIAKTVPAGIITYETTTGIEWGPMCASCILALIPVIILAILASKHLVRGLTFGALRE